MIINRHEIMWADLELDVYCGDKCDESEPQWHTFCEGDMDSDTDRKPLILDAKHFPPGTRVTVSIPECPECYTPRDVLVTSDGSNQHIEHETTCSGCGFDWSAWEQNEYS